MSDTSGLLAQRLSHYVRLSDDDRKLICAASRKRIRTCLPRLDILREPQSCTGAHVMLSGWACEYKLLRDGRRQIIAFLLPGDTFACDAHLLATLDYSVGAITAVQVGEIDPVAFDRLVAASPAAGHAFKIAALVDAATQRAHVVSLGQRSAIERVGHMLCELFLRLRAAGLVVGNRCDFPITQTDLADATGLTSVHVNRTLKELRVCGMISIKERQLTVNNFEALRHAVDFDPGYLRLDAIAGAALSPAVILAAA